MTNSYRMSSQSAKKKQEDKHLNLLKELLSIPTNKSCFDCNQRGPTYANTTIGSFVCISCSGKLRGMTPPHRVKSVSMASFGMDEIDFLRTRGNQFCRQVWLAHFTLADSRFDYKDDQKFKDHLSAKYEKKRWYAEPGTVVNNSYTFKVKNEVAPVVQDMPFNGIPTSIPRASAPTASPVIKSSDLLADLDFFSTTTNTAAFNPPPKQSPFPQSISQPSFANFQNADFFFPETKSTSTFFEAGPMNTFSNPTTSNQIPSGTAMHSTAMNGLLNGAKETATLGTSTPVEDRYSALKDLDALFTTAKSDPDPAPAPAPVPAPAPAASSPWTPMWSSGTNQQIQSNQMEASFAGTRAETTTAWNTGFPTSASNPFLGSSPVQPESATGMNHGQPALPWANFTAPANSGFPVSSVGAANSNNLFGFNVNSNPINAASLSSSQSLDLSPKVWGSPAGLNPFMDTTFSKGRSHNPFL